MLQEFCADQCFRDLAAQTEGFSGSDIAVVVKDVLMEPLRRTQEATHFKKVTGRDGVKYFPCPPSESGAEETTLYELAERGKKDVNWNRSLDSADYE